VRRVLCFLATGGELAFGLVETPLAGEYAAVLIAVAIAEHDDYVVDRAASGDGMAEEGVEDAGAVFEITDGFEQGRYG